MPINAEETIRVDNIKRSLCIISDIHVGSRYAVWTDKAVITREHNNLTKMRNTGQMYLYRKWLNMLEICNSFKVDTVINAGDTCAGCNHKENGASMMTPEIDYQTEGAIELLNPLVKDRVYHSVSGTGYHESIDVKIHKTIASRLKETASSSYFHGIIANIQLDRTNKTLNLAHAASNAMLYTATMLDRERIYLKYAEALGKLPHIDYFIRGHLHIFYHLDYPDMHIIQAPCWCAWSPIKDKVMLYGKTQPDIGFVLLIIDKFNRTNVIHFTYKNPRITDFVETG